MLYFNRPMKRLPRFVVILAISLGIALFSAAVTYTVNLSNEKHSTAASLIFQTTPSPPVEEDRSEVGSTDGIVAMGGVIALIVLIPILIQRKSWTQVK